MFKKQVEPLVLIEFIETASESEWGGPSFAQPKPKSNQMRFLRDFRNLNKQLERKLYPMPKINEMLLKL